MPCQVIGAAALPIDIRPLLGGLGYCEPEAQSWSRDELLAKLKGAAGLIALLNVKVDRELLAAASDLRVVANFAVGYDNIDVRAASERGIIVTNTPDVLTNATADLAFALLLATARRLGEGERLVREGRWQGWAPGLLLGCELSGRRLGIIGAGRIGRAMLKRAQGFDMELAYAGTRSVAEAEVLGAKRLPIDELFETCDFISLHCPLTEATRKIVDAGSLARMKKTAILVNTARGGCVDSDALADALDSQSIAGAGLDVFEDEPQVPKRLLACQRAVLAPHIGSATFGARSQMAEICAEAVRLVLAGECPPTAINPEAMA